MARRPTARQGRAAEALRVYDGFRKRLINDTGLEPSAALAAVEREVLETTCEPTDTTRPWQRSRLPAERSSLVGREGDLVELGYLVQQGPIVTITGPGGVGKTRVALRLAGDIGPQFLDGVRYVDLAAVEAHDVRAAVASGVGAVVLMGTPADAIIRALGELEVLLVLDCCERLVDEVASVVTSIVTACPGVRVLATSREPLRIEGESVFTLAPLGAEAVELFAQRARSARRGFELSLANRATAASICASLDGLPLAIELAAAQCDRMTLSDLEVQLRHPFTALDSGSRDAPPRHRGLARVVDWSWDLLSDDERTLFARMSVFPGGCTADAATEVCGFGVLDPTRLADLLGSLVRKSLVVAQLDGERARYRLLDTLRAYGLARLDNRGEGELIRRRLGEWTARVLAEMSELLGSPREAEGAAWQAREMTNLTAALGWAIDTSETDLAMRCLRPIIESFRQNELLPPDWSSDSLASWRDHPDAGYVWLREAQRGRDPDAVGRAAFACAENPSMSMHVAVWAHSAAVRIQRMWGRDPSANLAEMRRLAANSDDAHVRLHVAFGGYHASPRPSAEADRSLDDAEVAAEEIGVPSFVGMVGLFKLMGRTDDATVREAHRLRELFLGVGNTFLAAMCGALVDQIRPGTARFAEMLASTRNAFQDSPVWLLSFACGRAEFLASQGRAETAATLLGLPEVAWNCATPLAERAALDHPDAYERGRAMSLDDAARLLLDELESLVEQLESADIVG